MFPLVLCLIGYGIWSFSGFWGRFEGEAPSTDKTTEAVTTEESAQTTKQKTQETATGRYETQTIQAEHAETST